MLVMKFGGTSVGSAEAIQQTTDLIKKNVSRNPVVVVSALSKVTDLLIAAADQAAKGKISVDEIRARHSEVLDKLGLEPALLESEFSELENVLISVSYVKNVLPALYALIVGYGELLSSKILVAYGQKIGLNTIQLKSYDLGLITDSNYESATVLQESFDLIPRNLKKLDAGVIPVVTGFIAKDKSGSITTLGRGGSDYTASIIASAINAEELQIWTDVDGMMTADPKIVPLARSVSQLSFTEAGELAYFGAKILHPKTILPAVQKDIPVRILNTFNPEFKGTTIVKVVEDNDIVTAIACKINVTSINISSPKMLFAHGFMEKIFQIFAKHKMSVDMISTSELSVSLTVDGTYDISGILKELNNLGRVYAAYNRASISVVGRGMKRTPGIAGIIFGAIGAGSINTEMISMGASEINMNFVVDEKEVSRAVKLLHKAFFEINKQTIKSNGES